MFLDESACNERTGDRKYEWASIGTIAASVESLKYTEKWSILPLYTMDGYIAWEILKGSYNTEEFNEFVKNQVIPRTTPFPGPRSVLIMDNCRIHRNDV
jgi:DDE superfamily endonuclease